MCRHVRAVSERVFNLDCGPVLDSVQDTWGPWPGTLFLTLNVGENHLESLLKMQNPGPILDLDSIFGGG